MIRRIVHSDTPQILKNAPSFWREIDGDSLLGTLSLAGFSNFLKKGFANDSIVGWCAEKEKEFVAAVLFQKEYAFFTDKSVLTEVFWWAREDVRSTTLSYRCICAAEEYAKNNGIDTLQMSCMMHPRPDRLAKFYQRIGYKPVQTDFLKNV